MNIQLIRSATIRLIIGDLIFLIDPWLSSKGTGSSYAGELRSPLVELPFSPSEVVAGIDAVVISHLHSDHFDEAVRSMLDKTLPIICHRRDADILAGFGFTDVRAIEAQLEVGSVTISATDGRHGPDEVLVDMGEACGFTFRALREPTVYWVGDSILCPEVRAVIANERPDVIVVHACGATWRGIGPLVMDTQMVREVLQMAPDSFIVATHLDSVDHATVTRAQLRTAISSDRHALSRLRIPADGETLVFN